MNGSERNRFDFVVFSDARYVFGQADREPCLLAAGRRYRLSCHPYEPCLYITDENGAETAVHNAFDPSVVLASFQRGETVMSITGLAYDALSFCRMVEAAAGCGNINIDDAERVFDDISNPKSVARFSKSELRGDPRSAPITMYADNAETQADFLSHDPAYDLIVEYPDSALDFCLVKLMTSYSGCDSHKRALGAACRKLFAVEDEEPWLYDLCKAKGRKMRAEELFSSDGGSGKMTCRKAFLSPPYPNGYTEVDFLRVNQTLFPNGMSELEVCDWSTDWSDYFDNGHEWWGTLCATVYDKSLDRFVVIMASATD